MDIRQLRNLFDNLKPKQWFEVQDTKKNRALVAYLRTMLWKENSKHAVRMSRVADWLFIWKE
jgi:hypothetical protein